MRQSGGGSGGTAGFGDETLLSVRDQRRMSAYGAPFSGIAAQGTAGPAQLQMQALPPRTPVSALHHARPRHRPATATCAACVCCRSQDRPACVGRRRPALVDSPEACLPCLLP